MTQLNVGLLFGGCSGEHEVSIRSAIAIAQALQAPQNTSRYNIIPFYIQKNGVWQGGDVAQEVLNTAVPTPTRDGKLWNFPPEAEAVDVWFPILHGPNGEDGTVQGLLTLMQVPFVGSGVLGSTVGMDKLAMKTAFAQAGLPQVKYIGLLSSQVKDSSIHEQIELELGYPCFIKPANLGSSVGISKARSRSELETALSNAASYDRRLIVEAAVKAREVECAVLGNDKPKASTIGEITFESDFYDYETKYTAGQAQLYIPASLPDHITKKIQDTAIAAFLAIDASGLGRVDFFYVEETGEVLINEINTLPGFTATSMYPGLWEATGVSFPELVHQLIQFAQERK